MLLWTQRILAFYLAPLVAELVTKTVHPLPPLSTARLHCKDHCEARSYPGLVQFLQFNHRFLAHVVSY
jgi:hypothetical protein